MDEVLKEYYNGAKLKEKVILPDGTRLTPYLPEPALKEAVNLAIALGKPLLIKGEPGCGKTRLAAAIAYEMFHGKLHNKKSGISFKDIYFEWHVKSSSKAKDGLYRYDYIERLQHAQLSQVDSNVKIKQDKEYVKLGPLGLAFEQSWKFEERIVLLIDEIDKADSDFPNDLLRELDQMQYTIEEIDDPSEKEKSANPDRKPLVLITSNDEKELPIPFLRRCLFYHIKFPLEDRLREIAKAHFKELNKGDEIIEFVVSNFFKVREKMESEKDAREKKVTTSELIDWCEILLRHDENKIKALLSNDLPYATILFKNLDDLRFIKAHLE